MKKINVKFIVSASLIMLFAAGCTVKPQEIGYDKTAQYGKAVYAQLGSDQEPIKAPVTLYDAVARAIKYNSDRKLQMMRMALTKEDIRNASFDMLPKLTADAGYTARDKNTSSYSRIVDGNISSHPSFSQDQTSRNYDLVLSWNLLDFGLSYVRAQQTADKYMMAQEEKRKVLQNITKDVVNSYYKAVSAEHLLAKLEPVMKEVNMALDNSRTVAIMRYQSPIDALTYQKELMDILKSLQVLQRELKGAKGELGSLMGLKPGQDFNLDTDIPYSSDIDTINLNSEAMDLTALTYRPEIVQTYYQERITAKDIKAGILSILPGIRLSAGEYYDSNSYLVNNSWGEVGAQVSWNLFNVFKLPMISDMNKLKKAIEQQQRLTVSMAVLTQLHIAEEQFSMSVRDYKLASEYNEVESQIYDQVVRSESVGNTSNLKLIREKLNLLIAELKRDMAYSDMKNSFMDVYISMGLDPVPTVHDQSVEAISTAVKTRLNEWKEGSVELVSADSRQTADNKEQK